MKSVKDIVREYLLSIGAKGLCNPDLECGCGIDYLFECECPDYGNCYPAKISHEEDGFPIYVPIEQKQS